MITYNLYKIELGLKGCYYSLFKKIKKHLLSNNENNYVRISKQIKLITKLIRIRELQTFVDEDYILNMPLESFYEKIQDKINKIIEKYK